MSFFDYIQANPNKCILGAQAVVVLVIIAVYNIGNLKKFMEKLGDRIDRKLNNPMYHD